MREAGGWGGGGGCDEDGDDSARLSDDVLGKLGNCVFDRALLTVRDTCKASTYAHLPPQPLQATLGHHGECQMTPTYHIRFHQAPPPLMLMRALLRMGVASVTPAHPPANHRH